MKRTERAVCNTDTAIMEPVKTKGGRIMKGKTIPTNVKRTTSKTVNSKTKDGGQKTGNDFRKGKKAPQKSKPITSPPKGMIALDNEAWQRESQIAQTPSPPDAMLRKEILRDLKKAGIKSPGKELVQLVLEKTRLEERKIQEQA